LPALSRALISILQTFATNALVFAVRHMQPVVQALRDDALQRRHEHRGAIDYIVGRHAECRKTPAKNCRASTSLPHARNLPSVLIRAPAISETVGKIPRNVKNPSRLHQGGSRGACRRWISSEPLPRGACQPVAAPSCSRSGTNLLAAERHDRFEPVWCTWRPRAPERCGTINSRSRIMIYDEY